MRGREKTVKTLTISGNIYLKYEDEEQLFLPQTGDIMCYLNDDARPKNGYIGNYFEAGNQGYFRIDIFDGKEWNALSGEEFFDNKEHHFHKKELPIDCYNHFKELLQEASSSIVYYNYRGHYTRHEYQPGEFKGKKGHFNKNKKEKK